MFLKKAGETSLEPQVLREDRRRARKFGPCGVGEKALYLNSFFIERRYYLPISSVRRIYKRVAMSRGGFSGKGVFASVPYLVVEYEDGKVRQCLFRDEGMVDQLIDCFHQIAPEVPIHSAEAERLLQEKQDRLQKKRALLQAAGADRAVRRLQEAVDVLEKEPSLYQDLSRAARERRRQEISGPAYRHAAMAIFLLSAVALAAALWNQGLAGILAGDPLRIVWLGLAAVFLLAGLNVFPTRTRNLKKAAAALEEAVRRMETFLRRQRDFPVPARYAHPVVLRRMMEIMAEKRAGSESEALEVLREDLRQVNALVTVEQEEYEEIVAIKPLFLAAQL